MPYAPDLAGCALDGRYELHAVVGEGAFGRVYRGRDRRLARTVAVKVIKPWWTDDPDWAVSFEREAQLLARVSDPGIVQIFDVGQADEGLYYVAEFVDGESLASRLRRGPLAPLEACEIAEQLCRALGQAHAQRIVHRDVKPANVLISIDGRVKVGDFGVARLAEGSSEGPGATIVGTPKYMAPEQARGWPTTPATDTYSVGVVLYEMLAGHVPFRADSAVELALRHLHDSPAELPAGTPRALAEVVERALAKEPERRYQSGAEMAEALAHARVAGPAAGSPVGSDARPSEDRDFDGRLSAGAGAESSAGEGGRSRADGLDPTRVAPKLTPRRNVNPSARRRSIALIGAVFGLVVAMFVSAKLLAPPPRVRVPDFRGLGRPAITAKARRVHMHPQFTAQFDAVRKGIAIAQTPAAGALVNKGSRVRIVLSAGPPPVKVPDVLGEASGKATSVLDSLGLRVSVASVPAPGVGPGTITAQAPVSGRYVSPGATVALSAAEVPRWRALTSFAGSGHGSSVPFSIRGRQWRVVYRMSYVGTCTLIFICFGPSAQVVDLGGGAHGAVFNLNNGDSELRAFQSGPGVYQIKVTPGSDTAQWSMEVEDYY